MLLEKSEMPSKLKAFNSWLREKEILRERLVFWPADPSSLFLYAISSTPFDSLKPLSWRSVEVGECDGMGLSLRAKKEINGQQEVIAFIAHNPVSLSLGRSPTRVNLRPVSASPCGRL